MHHLILSINVLFYITIFSFKTYNSFNYVNKSRIHNVAYKHCSYWINYTFIYPCTLLLQAFIRSRVNKTNSHALITQWLDTSHHLVIRVFITRKIPYGSFC